jgi:uncharacterized membrane protein
MKVSFKKICFFIVLEVVLFIITPLFALLPIICIIGWAISKAANE